MSWEDLPSAVHFSTSISRLVRWRTRAAFWLRMIRDSSVCVICASHCMRSYFSFSSWADRAGKVRDSDVMPMPPGPSCTDWLQPWHRPCSCESRHSAGTSENSSSVQTIGRCERAPHWMRGSCSR